MKRQKFHRRSGNAGRERYAGCLLVASPTLTNSLFARSVVLVIHDGDQGAMGFVLNRRLGESARVVWRYRDGRGGQIEAPVYLGGPLFGPLVAIHQKESLGEQRILDGVYLASNVGQFDKLVEGPDQPFRLIVGRSGWAPHQLQEEVRRGVWLVLPADEKLVFGDTTHLWRKCLRGVVANVYRACMGHFDPEQDASLN